MRYSHLIRTEALEPETSACLPAKTKLPQRSSHDLHGKPDACLNLTQSGNARFRTSRQEGLEDEER